MLLCVMGVGFENTCTVSGKRNEDARGQSKISSFVFPFGVN